MRVCANRYLCDEANKAKHGLPKAGLDTVGQAVDEVPGPLDTQFKVLHTKTRPIHTLTHSGQPHRISALSRASELTFSSKECTTVSR